MRGGKEEEVRGRKWREEMRWKGKRRRKKVLKHGTPGVSKGGRGEGGMGLVTLKLAETGTLSR